MSAAAGRVREDGMRRHRRTLTLAGAVLTASLAGLGASAGAAAAASAPGILIPGYFACNSNGVCSPGPGDVGVRYAADMTVSAADNGPFAITLASGSLPPGLQLSADGAEESLISGTPTAAGTYDFTLQITDQAGGSGTQQLFITVGTGTADNLVATRATYQVSRGVGGLDVEAWDVNAGATYTVYATSTGKEIGTMTGLAYHGSWDGGASGIANPQNVTIKDSLGSSVSLPVTLLKPYR
jgi:Putative Ig domain